MMKMKYIVILIIAVSVMLSSCYGNFNDLKTGDYTITNIKIYKDTIAWKLALAVKGENIRAIKEIVENNPVLLNYQDEKYGATLLMWSIGMEKYKSAETLLSLGADPDIEMYDYGGTALFIASSYSWIDNSAKKSSKYVELLLSYDADPNIIYIGYDEEGNELVIEPGITPLMRSINCGIEKTKALVKAGADIEYTNENGRTAAVYALKNNFEPEYAHYLIVENKATVSEPYYARPFNISGYDENREFYPVNLLRKWIFDLDSEKYKLKMEIVEEFSRQGVDYWGTVPDKDTTDSIKKLYPDSWQEYILKY